MNIFILSGEEPLHLPGFAERIFNEKRESIKGIAVFPFFSWKRIRDQFLLYGMSGFTKRSFRYLHAVIKGKSVRDVARKHGIPVYSFEGVNAAGLLSLVKEAEIDLVISLYCPKIFGKELISLPSKGCINTHFGLLPRYRGISPIFWALLNQEKEIGITVHYINEGIDDGRIILRDTVQVGSKKIDEIYRDAFALAPQLLLEAITKIEQGAVSTADNNAKEGSYYTYPKKEDYKRFRSTCRGRL